VSEAGLRKPEDIVSMQAFTASSRATNIENGKKPEEIDTVRVELADGIEPPRPRAYVTSSSCGVCSADVLDAFPEPYAPLHRPGWKLQPRQALELVRQMRARQKMFDLTGALHAAALVGPESEVLYVREDVGRHNAVDKVIGHALMEGEVPLTDHVLVVSGRVSYEIVAKALTACIGAIVAVSGPTTLAVDIARAHDSLLIGFARDDRMNVYSGRCLQAIQGRFGFVPAEAVALVAQRCNATRADVHGVLTFYADLRTQLPPAIPVRLCAAEACQSVGGRELRADWEQACAQDAHLADLTGVDEPIFCLGNCALGPAAFVGDRLIGRASVDRIAAAVREQQDGESL
jgi:FdhD protein